MKIKIITAPAIKGVPRKITQHFVDVELLIIDPEKAGNADGYVTRAAWIISKFDHLEKKFFVADWFRFNMRNAGNIIIPKESCELIEDPFPQSANSY